MENFAVSAERLKSRRDEGWLSKRDNQSRSNKDRSLIAAAALMGHGALEQPAVFEGSVKDLLWYSPSLLPCGQPKLPTTKNFIDFKQALKAVNLQHTFNPESEPVQVTNQVISSIPQ